MGDTEFIEARADLAGVFASFVSRGKNIHRLTPIFAEMLVTAVHDRIEAEGPGWQPLAASTLRKRRKHGHGAKMLQDTGNFVGSIHGEHGPDFAEAATNVPYIIYSISKAPRTIIPYRNPFELEPAEANRIADEVVDMLLSELLAE